MKIFPYTEHHEQNYGSKITASLSNCYKLYSLYQIKIFL